MYVLCKYMYGHEVQGNIEKCILELHVLGLLEFVPAFRGFGLNVNEYASDQSRVFCG